MISSPMAESRLPVGSSARRMRGLPPMARRWRRAVCWPQESWVGSDARATRDDASSADCAALRRVACVRRAIQERISTLSITFSRGRDGSSGRTKRASRLRKGGRASLRPPHVATCPPSSASAAAPGASRADQVQQRALAATGGPMMETNSPCDVEVEFRAPRFDALRA